MARKTREIGIRLSVKDKELVERALKSMGADGEAAFKRIQKSAAPASAAMLSLNRASASAQQSVKGWYGTMTAGLLPTLSLVAAIGGAKRAMEDFGNIADRSKSSGLDPEYFQGLAYGAEQAGVEIGELSSTLDAFYKNAELAEKGRGTLVKTLKAVNPELLKAIQLADSQADRLALVADALDEATDKAGLAAAVFGDIGPRFAQVFEGGAEALERTIAKARELGIVVSRDVIERADEIGDEFATATRILDTEFKQVLIEIAPLLVTIAQNVAGIIRELRNLDSAGAEALNAGTLRKEIAQYEAMLSRGDYNLFTNPDGVWDAKGVQRHIDQLRARLRLAEQGPTVPSGGRGRGRRTRPDEDGDNGGGGLPPDEEATRIADLRAKAIADTTKRLREQLDALRMTNREQAIQNALSSSHTTLADAEGRKIAELAGSLYDQKEAIDAVNTASSFMAQTASDAFGDLINGAKSFDEVLEDTRNTLVKVALQAALLGEGPLAGLFGTKSQMPGQTGGLLGSLFGALLGGATGSPGARPGYYPGLTGPSLFSAKGNAFAAPPLSSFSNRIVRDRTAFTFAAKGVMGEKGGSPGEGILPLMRDRLGRLGVSASGMSDPVVNVTIVTGASENRVERSRGPNGSIDVKAFIIGTVKEGFATGGMDGLMSTTYGLRRRPRL